MKIQRKLEELLFYYEASRQAGHTTLMKQGTDNYQGEKYVLAFNMQHGDNLGFKPQEIVTLNSLDRLRGSARPLAVDNGTIMAVLKDTIAEMSVMDEENRELRAKLDIIRKILK